MEATDTSAVGYVVSAIAEGIFHLHSPFSKQPFRHVGPVAVTPTLQL
jgi:hypothetical protein